MISGCLIDDATRRDATVDGRSCGWLVGWGGVVDGCRREEGGRGNGVGDLRFK